METERKDELGGAIEKRLDEEVSEPVHNLTA